MCLQCFSVWFVLFWCLLWDAWRESRARWAGVGWMRRIAGRSVYVCSVSLCHVYYMFANIIIYIASVFAVCCCMVGLCLCFGMHALPQCQRCYGCAAMPCPVFRAAAGVSGLAVAACLERGYCLVVDAGDVDLPELTFVS